MNADLLENIRFFAPETLSGAENMAVDEALLISTQKLKNTAYLRFYKWQPATLSFGYNQRIERIIDPEMCNRLNISVVRRMTGGKMVFHNDELTFSICFYIPSIKEKLPEKYKFLDVFMKVMQPLVNGLNNLGLPAKFSNAHELNKTSHNRVHCYAVAAGHSVFVKGKKLIGAAGVIKNNCISVHGSIPINFSYPPQELFLNNVNPNQELAIASLSDFLAEKSILEIPEFVKNSFSNFFNVPVVTSILDDSEKKLIQKLIKDKYSRIDWKREKTL